VKAERLNFPNQQIVSMMKNKEFRPHTLVELLHRRAQQSPETLAYAFLADGEVGEEEKVTYRELEHRVRAVATQLQSSASPGDRVLLLYPQGVDYVIGFLACLYAGVIGVPIFPPRGKPADMRIQTIADDAQANLALTTDKIHSHFAHRLEHAPHLEKMQWLATDAIPADIAASWKPPEIDGNTLAFLQYTSGSTGVPKGVMVSHGNLLHNSEYTAGLWQYDADSVMVTWLPIFHDMGLIFGILQPLYKGFPCYLMSPAAFVQHPFRWLKAISYYRATHSGAPNFAYDLCVQKIPAEQRAALDLSSWCMSLNAAEPVRAETFRQFYEAFAPCGLRETTVCHGYGLAEATLIVAGALKRDAPVYFDVRSGALEQHRVLAAEGTDQEVQTLVGSGYPGADGEVAIVHPETLTRCPPEEVGEIWVSSPSVAHGYWQRPDETEETFQAHLSDSGEGPFMRTGDLGFMRDGELFVTGRIKDVIIIRGNNYYPQDIEFTVEKSHPALRAAGHGAAFSVEDAGEEKLVVIQEVERSQLRKLNAGEVVGAIRQAVSEEYDLQVHAVVLLKTATIPRTSSGKIQRSTCQTAFMDRALDSVAAWQQTSRPERTTSSRRDAVTREDIKSWLLDKLSGKFQITAAEIDVREPLARYGLDSMTAVGLSGELEDWLGRPFPPTLLYDYPSIDAITRYVWSRDRRVGGERAVPENAARGEPIAIVGMGCRFPGAEDIRAFRQLLREGMDAVTTMPPARRMDGGFADTDGLQGGFLEDVAAFDASFFGISPREAAQMDPQQRLLLEVCWESLEDAGMAAEGLRGSLTGVFVGISTDDYSNLQLEQGVLSDAYSGTGNAFSIAANRLSYVLDFRGPSMAIDSACSSSLVAIHQACLNLRQGECDMALAGGVNLILSPHFTGSLTNAGMLAPDGRCKTFDAGANGYVRGEGCGVVVLKRLADAQRDGDSILALVKGSAVNQDGRSNGLTAPNSLSQQAVVRRALENAGVEAAQIGYLEAHGTGTALGDPIEMNALKEVLLQGRGREDTCWIGSVKTNIGHLEAAAGIAGFIKVALSLQHGEIFPHLNLRELNRLIEIADTPLEIPTQRKSWPAHGRARFAGVSSFGFGGTNAHAILGSHVEGGLADPDSGDAESTERPEHLLLLSAREESVLRGLAQRYESYLETHADVSLADICFTANGGCTRFSHRLAVAADSTAQMREKLGAYGREESEIDGLRSGETGEQIRPRSAFLFTGQGAQFTGMGRQLYETQPGFRRTLDECEEILRPHLEKSLLEVIFQPSDDGQKWLDATAYTQPALFALEYGLARLWQSWGVEPDALMGHSVGEYAAACIAGVFSLEDGLRLIAARGRLMQDQPEVGAMAAVRAPEEKVASPVDLRAGAVSIAAINGPGSTVISGERQAVESTVECLREEGFKATFLAVSHAFHSPLMEPVLEPFARVAETVVYKEPHIDLISNVTGGLATDIATSEYWVDHIRQPVRFASGMDALHKLGCGLFVEVGPKPILLGMGRQCLDPAEEKIWLPSLRQEGTDWQQLFQSLGTLYLHGFPIDWRGVDREYPRRRVSLPSYPFQRQRHWIEAGPTLALKSGNSQVDIPLPNRLHPLWEKRWQSPLVEETVYETRFSSVSPSFLADHVIFENIVVPGSSHISMLLGVAELSFGEGSCTLEDILFSQALVIPSEAARVVQVVATPGENGVKLISFAENQDPGSSWVEHVSGRLIDGAPVPEPVLLESVRERCSQQMPSAALYRAMEQLQFRLGSEFQWVESIWQGDDEILCRMKLPRQFSGAEEYQLHPGLIDSCFQPSLLTLAGKEKGTFVPFMVEKFLYYRRPTEAAELWCHVTFRKPPARDQERLVMDTRLCDESGQIIAEAVGLELRQASRKALRRSLEKDFADLFYEVTWEPLARNDRQPVDGRGSWLILTDGEGIGGELAARLHEEGERCVVVERGDAFGQFGVDHYCVDPAVPEDFVRLLRGSFRDSSSCESGELPPCRGIVHLWSLDTVFDQITRAGDLHEAQLQSCGSALHLVQALAESGWIVMPRLCLVTRGAQIVQTESHSVQAQQTALWGLGQVISLEYPDLHCLRVDLDPSIGSDAVGDLFEAIRAAADDDRIAYRQGVPYTARLARTNYPANGQPAVPIREDGSYLITGGLGALGLKVADWLVERGAGHLVLVGRRSPGEEARDEIDRLIQAGARVTIAAADVSKADDVARILATTERIERPLRGVVHAAGVIDDGLLLRQDWDRFSKVMAPKVAGAWNLHDGTRQLELDFFVCFSSITALLGAGGQGNYAAANAFMDGLAQHRQSSGLPGLSINWGPWGEVGMIAALDRRDWERWVELGFGPIEPAQGVAILDQLLARKETSQAAVLPIDWSLYLQQFRNGAATSFFEAVKPIGKVDKKPESGLPQGKLLEQLRSTPADSQRETLVSYVRTQIGQVARLQAVDQIQPRQRLFDLGLDSLMAVELKDRLQADLGHPLSATLIFDFPTIEALADHLYGDVLGLAQEEPEEPEADATEEGLVELEDLSREEMGALLDEKLSELDL